MPRKRLSRNDCMGKRMELSIIRDVRGKWTKIYWPKHKLSKFLKRM